MELPAEVLIHSEALSLKGTPGTLIRVDPDGYYELNLKFGEGIHRVLLPIDNTVLISAQAEDVVDADFEVER